MDGGFKSIKIYLDIIPYLMLSSATIQGASGANSASLHSAVISASTIRVRARPIQATSVDDLQGGEHDSIILGVQSPAIMRKDWTRRGFAVRVAEMYFSGKRFLGNSIGPSESGGLYDGLAKSVAGFSLDNKFLLRIARNDEKEDEQ